MKGKKTFENVEIEDISAEGKAVARVDNRVIFVEGAVPGDLADVQVIGKKKKFLIAKPTHFHRKSELRSDPKCDHFGVCGGCKWQNMKYEHQLLFKQKQVFETLKRIGKVEIQEELPIVGAEKTEYYRNKIEFSFSNKRWLTSEQIASEETFENNVLGFHVPKFFDKVVDIEKCHLQEDPSNDIRNFIREFALKHKISFYDIREHEGFLRNMFIRISNTRQIMLILSVGKDDDKTLKKLLNAILERFADITSLYYTINEKKNDVLYDLDLILFHGSEFIEEQLGDLSFKIGPKSFYQTNSYQADKLFKLVKDFSAVNKDDVVFDLYSGLGTIGLFLANDCKEVFCIESVEEAVELGKINAIDNKIDNVSFYCGDMKDEIMNQSLKKPDVVICDPPRAGMHRKVVERLLQFQAEKIVYVSCNVATQARDLELLKAQYDILKSQPVDMFPHTHHIENVVLLKRR